MKAYYTAIGVITVAGLLIVPPVAIGIVLLHKLSKKKEDKVKLYIVKGDDKND